MMDTPSDADFAHARAEDAVAASTRASGRLGKLERRVKKLEKRIRKLENSAKTK